MAVNSNAQSKKRVVRDRSIIADAIRVVGKTLEQHGRCIVIDIDGEHVHLPISELANGNYKPLVTKLAEGGRIDLTGRLVIKNIVNEILRTGAGTKTIVIASNGYSSVNVDGERFNVYVWGSRVHPFGPKPPVNILASKANKEVQSAGTRTQWRKHIGERLHGNPYLIVTMAHALSAALRRPFRQPQLVLALVAESTSGKTSMQQAVQSVIGPPEQVKTMSGTMIGLMDYLQKHPDQPVFFQDTRQADSIKDLLQIVFNAADGSGRARHGEDAAELAATLILSNERSLMDMATKSLGDIDQGIFARVLELHCNAPYGAFHCLHDAESAAAFAESLVQSATECHGAVWPFWIQKLSAKWDWVEKQYETLIPRLRKRIASHVKGLEINPIDNRLLNNLAFSAWAGCIASDFGMLPLTRGEIADAFGIVFTEHIKRQNKAMTPVAEKIISDVRGYIDENLAQFPDLRSFSDDSARSSVRGYRYNTKNGVELILFLPNVFDRQFVSVYGRIVYSVLDRADWLYTGVTKSRGNQLQVRMPVSGKQKSFVAVKSAIRFDDDD